MKWLEEANKLIGIKEFAAPKSNPLIVQMWKDIKRGGIKDDKTPWCAAFVGACLERVGIVSTRFESAKSYLKWGVTLERPVEGCIAVFDRDGGGHVGFVVGVDRVGNYQILGGNQGDAVKVAAFPRSRNPQFRWPDGIAIPSAPLPMWDKGAPVSTKES
ncbi:tail-associated lysozyme [Aeromonas phage Gekk3-15]